MSKQKTNLDALNEHLFETIKDLRQNSSRTASEADTVIESAKAIAGVGKIIVDTYKLKVDAMRILSKSESPVAIAAALQNEELLNFDYVD